MRNTGAVSDSIINAVRSLTKADLTNIKKELQVVEPALIKWARESVKDDVANVRMAGGITIHSEDGVRSLGSVIIQAKIEGFLTCLVAQDKEWASAFYIDDEESGDIPYRNCVNAFLEGRLEKEKYDVLALSMTKDEKNNPKHWKHQAIRKFKENQKKSEVVKTAKDFLESQKSKRSPLSDGDPGVPLSP